MKHSSKIIGLLALALVLGGCSQTSTAPQVAGGEDFPNTVSAFGVATQEALDSSGTWNTLGDIPLSAPSPNVDDATASPLPRVAGRVAALDTGYTRLDLSDTASGLAYLYSLRITDSLIETDTLAVLWNEFAKDVQQGNEQIRWARLRKIERGTGRWMHQVISAAGTDTMVTPLAAKANRIHLRQVTGWGARSSVLDMELDPGPDASYDTESDSRIFWSRVIQLKGTDTLESVLWQDGDGDSITLDRASGKLGIVDFRRVVPTPIAHPLIQRFEERGRLRVDPRDSTRNQPLRYARTTQWKSGRTVTERIARLRSDSDLVAGDTAVSQRLAIFGSDTVRTAFRMLMGQDLSKDTSHRLLALDVYVHKPSGRTLSLTFVSDSPLKDGSPVRTGSVTLMEFRPAQGTFTVIGRMLDGALTAHVSDGRNLSGTGTWNAAGELILWKPD